MAVPNLVPKYAMPLIAEEKLLAGCFLNSGFSLKSPLILVFYKAEKTKNIYIIMLCAFCLISKITTLNKKVYSKLFQYLN